VDDENGDPDRVPSDRFFTADAGESTSPLTRWAEDPVRHAGVLTVLGVFGVFFEQSNVFFQIVIGAPVFEELLKFGVALGVVALLRIDSRVVLFVLALASGAGFGIMEHYVTYPDEAVEALRFRVAFHGGSCAMSAAAYGAIRESVDLHARWAVTLPASVVHWANNFVALAVGLTSIASGEVGQGPALVFGQAMAAVALLLAFWGLFAREQARRFGAWAWETFAPASIKGPAPGTGPGPPEGPGRPPMGRSPPGHP
jgi:hypothetical protein